MCWTAKELNKCVSDGNVYIFKVCKIIDGKICGFYYQEFKYTLYKKYTTQIFFQKNFGYNRLNGFSWQEFYGYNGFHSYSKTNRKIAACAACLDCLGVYYNDDIQRFDVYNGHYNKDFVIVEGYLPKGTIYYENEYGEIISDSIVLTNIIEKIQ